MTIKELLVRAYIEAIQNRDYRAAESWRSQLKDKPWWKFW